MNKILKLKVLYNSRLVGTLMWTKQNVAAFAYSKEWLADGFSISPRSLPLLPKVFLSKIDPFDGIFGVFADSLPDGWGRLLVDRMLLKHKINPHTLSPLDRLAIVGASGMGALTYDPEQSFEIMQEQINLDKLAQECYQVLTTDYNDNIDELVYLGGSSGGARPKILTQLNGKDWIVKFALAADNKDIGLEEYEYSLRAKACGISMTETMLLPSKLCKGYFATQRFDKTLAGRVHMLSVSAVLETSHRIPNLDYDILMQLTAALTKNMEDIKNLYRLMCFNVFAHNRDDHSKNFSFIYNEQEKSWHLAPAYDLTYSYSIGGEHATTVHGNGTNPGLEDILAIAQGIGINVSEAKNIALAIYECVHTRLKKYLRCYREVV